MGDDRQQGLYDPRFEHDSCGFGLIANLDNAPSRELVDAALVRPEKRIKTRPSKAAKARRVDTKKARSSVKAGRGRVHLD